MVKTKEELTTYAELMLQRGDRWASIINYLNREGATSEIRKEIVIHLEAIEKMVEHKPPRKSTIDINIILGTFIIGVGLLMVFFLWGKGVISIIPFVIIAGGVWAVTRQGERKSGTGN